MTCDRNDLDDVADAIEESLDGGGLDFGLTPFTNDAGKLEAEVRFNTYFNVNPRSGTEQAFRQAIAKELRGMADCIETGKRIKWTVKVVKGGTGIAV